MKEWGNAEVFRLAFGVLTKRYSAQQLQISPDSLKRLYIDSTMVKCTSAIDGVGPNHYDRMRRATKISIICDDNMVPLSSTFYDANVADNNTIEESLYDMPKFSVDCRHTNYLIADKGYKSKIHIRRTMLRTLRVHLVTPRKINEKKRLSALHSKLLTGRSKIENLFCRLDKFGKLQFRRERLLANYKHFHFLALAVLVSERLK